MSFYALAPKELQSMIKEEEQKKKEEKEAEANASIPAKEEEKKPEKEISSIYEHPQSRLLTKMLGLVGSKAAPCLAADPTPVAGGDVRVLDRKLEVDEERLKKDNKRWRGVVYLTVAVCLVILCLVVTQVISSVTATTKPLPNIDVSEPHRAGPHPRPEPLVAAVVPLRNTATDAPKPADTDLVQMETVIKKAGDGEGDGEEVKGSTEETLSGDGDEGVKFIPVPLASPEAEESEVPTTTKEDEEGDESTPTPAPRRHRPFFLPIMFEQSEISFEDPSFVPRPSASITPPRPFPRPDLTARPRNPLLEFIFSKQSPLFPPAMSVRHEPMLFAEMPKMDPFEDDHFISDVIRGMTTLLRTVKPLLEESPTSNASTARHLRPSARLIAEPRRLPRPPFLPARARGLPLHVQRRFPQAAPPPAAYRPGPFRAPVSIVPPTNQRGPPPRPANERAFPPRAPGPQRNFHQSPAVNGIPRPFAPPLPPHLRGSGSHRHSSGPVHHQGRNKLIGNPQYSYPNTATGIQDIIRYIHDERRPQHTPHPPHHQNVPFQSHSPSTRHSDEGNFNNNNGGGFHGDDRHHGNSFNNNNGGFSGPVYPPGYQQLELGPRDQPFHLMLDVYPVDSDRYQGADAGVAESMAVPELELFQEDPMVMHDGVRESLDGVFPDDMPFREGRAFPDQMELMLGDPFADMPLPQGRDFAFEVPLVGNLADDRSHRKDEAFLHFDTEVRPFPDHMTKEMKFHEEIPSQREGEYNHHDSPKTGLPDAFHPPQFKAVSHARNSLDNGNAFHVMHAPTEKVAPHHHTPSMGGHFAGMPSDHPHPHEPEVFHDHVHNSKVPEEVFHHQMVLPQGRAFPEPMTIPQVVPFPEDVHHPQGRGLAGHVQSHEIPSAHHDMMFGEQQHETHHQQMDTPHSEPRYNDEVHQEVDHFPAEQAEFQGQRLTEVREVPEMALMGQDEGFPGQQRTPLYKLLLGGGPEQRDRHMLEADPQQGDLQHSPNNHHVEGIYFPQNNDNEEEPFAMDNPFLRHRESPEQGEAREGRRFDGNPWLHI